MPGRTIAIEDRHAIEDLYAQYVWALDTGDVNAFLALFTEHGVFGDTAGRQYHGHAAIGSYVTELTNSAPFRGRQDVPLAPDQIHHDRRDEEPVRVVGVPDPVLDQIHEHP